VLGPLEPAAGAGGLGLIRSGRSPFDRHSKLLFLTEAGQQLAQRIDGLILEGRTIAMAQRAAA
jgi:DNA-binding MarR family transcriptional regulator